MNIKSAIFYILLWISIFSVKAQGNAKVKDFTLLNTVDNQQVSLSDFSDKKGVVVIFTSNYCPYSKLYEDRIEGLASEYSNKGIQFLLINPNNPQSSKDDSIEEMAKKARERGYKFPYLADKEQKVAKMFGASKTPEAFVLKSSSNQFNIIYRGKIDNNPQVASDVSSFYLKDAIEAILNNKEVATTSERPTGCMIKRN